MGLCHSVQVCCSTLLKEVGLEELYGGDVQWKIAGINHQAWLLEVTKGRRGPVPGDQAPRARRCTEKHNDMVRFE